MKLLPFLRIAGIICLSYLIQSCAASAAAKIKKYEDQYVVIRNTKTGDCLTSIAGKIQMKPYQGLGSQRFKLKISYDAKNKPLFVLTQGDHIIKSGEGEFSLLPGWEDNFDLAFQAYYKSKKDTSALILSRPVSNNEFMDRLKSDAQKGFKLVWTQSYENLRLDSPMEIKNVNNEPTVQNWNILSYHDLPHPPVYETASEDQTYVSSPAPDKVINGLFMAMHYKAPADPQGAVGLNHSVAIINGLIQTYNLTDSSNNRFVSSEDWWSPIVDFDIEKVTDPQILYDSAEDRWVMTAMLLKEGNDGHDRGLAIAVSKSGDPNGDWACAFLDQANDLGLTDKRIDQPRLALSSNKLVVICFLFDNDDDSSLNESVITVFNKARIYNDPYEVEFQNFRGGVTIPARTMDNDTSLYLVTRYRNSETDDLRILVQQVMGDHSSEACENCFRIKAVKYFRYPFSSNQEFNAPQKDSSKKLDTDDSRIASAVYRDSRLWFVHTLAIQNEEDEVIGSTIHWYQVDVETEEKIDNGFIEPLPGQSYAFPSIAINKNHDMLIGMSVFGADIYPSAGYYFKGNTDSENIVRQPYIYQAGSTYFDMTIVNDNGAIRWGDYSSTIVDPRDDLSFYTIQEFCRKYDAFTRPINKTGEATSWAKLTILPQTE